MTENCVQATHSGNRSLPRGRDDTVVYSLAGRAPDKESFPEERSLKEYYYLVRVQFLVMTGCFREVFTELKTVVEPITVATDLSLMVEMTQGSTSFLGEHQVSGFIRKFKPVGVVFGVSNSK